MAFAKGGMITSPLVDSGKYLAYAAADRTERVILGNNQDNIAAFHEWIRFDLAGTANGGGKISEMGATQQVTKNFTQIRKVNKTNSNPSSVYSVYRRPLSTNHSWRFYFGF